MRSRKLSRQFQDLSLSEVGHEKKTTFPAQKEVRAWRKCLVVLQEHSMASGEVPVLQAGKKDKFVFKKDPFLLLKTSLSFF